MQLAVTGGSGFVGANFIEYVLEQNYETRVLNLDLLTYKANARNNDIAAESGRYAFKRVDVRDKQQVDRIIGLTKPDAIVHFAAATEPHRSLPSAGVEFASSNVVGTVTLLDAAVKHGIKKFVYISTEANPINAYFASKISSEFFVKAYADWHGIDATISRCPNNFGKYQQMGNFIPEAIMNLLADKPINVFGEGLVARQWIHVSDHCNAIQAILCNGESGSTYNVVGGRTLTDLALAQTICQKLGKDPEKYITHSELAEPDVIIFPSNNVLDNGATLGYGYRPLVPFDMAIDLTINYYKKQLGVLAF